MLNSGSSPAACQVDPGGQLPALHQHYVRPPLLREVVEGADADDTAADDYDTSMGLHGSNSPAVARIGAESNLVNRNATSAAPDATGGFEIASSNVPPAAGSTRRRMARAHIRWSRRHQTHGGAAPILGPLPERGGDRQRQEAFT